MNEHTPTPLLDCAIRALELVRADAYRRGHAFGALTIANNALTDIRQMKTQDAASRTSQVCCTVLPWEIRPALPTPPDDRIAIASVDINAGDYVGDIYETADAEFIVRACNAHDALVAQNAALLAALRVLYNEFKGYRPDCFEVAETLPNTEVLHMGVGQKYGSTVCFVQMARNAIAAAERTQP